MSGTSANIVSLLTYLLPGFVAAAVFFSLTPFPRRDSFERTVQALIFTIVVQATVVVVRTVALGIGRYGGTVGKWTEDVALLWSVALAVLLGLSSASISNRDTVHRVLRKLGITHQTSYASEWYGAFCRGSAYVVLHLTGERRLYGWPEEWPSTPGKGHFHIVQAEWLTEDGPVPLPPENTVVVAASDVELVELVPHTSNCNQETSNGRAKGTDATADA